MNHQITLEELGIIPEQKPEKVIEHINYAFPCGGCVCNHCANSVECLDNCTGEMLFACFTCDECRRYDNDGKGPDNWREECRDYKVTDAEAVALRKKFKVLKPEGV